MNSQAPTSATRPAPLLARAAVCLLMLLAAAVAPPRAGAISFELDSIAAWGKFPRFCIDVYRWGDKFFNSYDSTYVQGSGKRFNVKVKTDSWSDFYNFRLDNGYRLEMRSRPSTSVGLYVTYMAVSLGYDYNTSKLLGLGEGGARKRFNLQFNCSLLAVEYYTQTNDVGTHIKNMGYPGDVRKVDIPFKGIHSSSWEVNLYYFFNHKNYSQAAAFYYSKIQMRSSGSLYAGLSFWGQDYKFDFEDLVGQLAPDALPSAWDYHYYVHNKNYAIKVGYAYNWVFHPGWCFGVSEAPTFGFRRGNINDGPNKLTLGLSNRFRASLVYNLNKRWFFGGVLDWNLGLVYDKEHSLIGNTLSGEISAGYRFELFK